MTRYFLFDCETGGLDETTDSLLTLYGVVLNKDLTVLDEIDLMIKPDDGRYSVNIEALKINKINLLSHDETAIRYSDARTKLQNFLFKATLGDNKALVPAGHNVNLDINFLKIMLPDYKQFLSHRVLDTGTLGQFLRLCDIIPESNRGSLSELCTHFGIDPSGAHNAKNDVLMTHKLLLKLRGMGMRLTTT